MEQASESHPYKVQLENYEGPLDLLLDLIRKQEVDIYDIPIARITGQYLEYLHQGLDRLDTETAGEFLLMAATLIHIKSKMLLPPDPTLSPEEQEQDPRAELVQQLLEHEKFKHAAQMLHQKQTVQAAMWSAPALQSFLDPDDEPGLAVTLIDLIKAFQQVLDRAKERPVIAIESEKVSVAEMMQNLCNLLSGSSQPLPLQQLFTRIHSRDALLATFLALLELVRLQAVLARQNEIFGEIMIHRHKMFDAVFAGSQREIDKDYD